MNQRTFLQEYKSCADEQTLKKIWQHKVNNDTIIDLNKSNLNDLTPIKGCNNLERLYVNSTLIGDLKPLIGLSLKELYIKNTKITDIRPLEKIPTLKRMNLSSTPIKDITPLKNLLNLHSLYLNNLPIEDLYALKNLSLAVLEINHTKVESLSPLKEIGFLSANNTNIIDLMPLKSKTSLRVLNISSTKVSDISPLKDLPILLFLFINDTQVNDISPLAKIIQKAEMNIDWTSKVVTGYPTIFVKGCPLINPPINILEQGKKAILDYWGLEEIEKNVTIVK